MKSNSILKSILDLKNLIRDFENNSALSNQFASFSNNLRELDRLQLKLQEEKIYLVIVGLFKRGKSSIVNALIKREVAPYSIIPLTSVVTLFEYGEKDQLKVIFTDNNVVNENIETISEFVTETKNPQNIKNVDFVNILLNTDFLKRVTLVDTPGIGSTFENNTETTYNYVEKIDAALFTLSADLPISKTEVEFLKQIRASVPKIIFVLNKIDLINQKEIDNILAFNISVLKNIYKNEEFVIIPVSAKLCLEGINNNDNELISKSGFQLLVDKIESMLKAYKKNVIFASTKNQLDNLILKTDAFLKIKLKTLLTPIDELNADYDKMHNSLEIMHKEKDDFEILIQGKIKKLQEYVTSTLYDFADNLFKNYSDELNKNLSGLIDDLRIYGSKIINDKYFPSIEQSYEPLKEKLEKEIIERFHNILYEYSQGSNRFLNELFKIFAGQSLFNFQEVVDKFDLKIFTVFYFYFENNYNPVYLKVNLLKKTILRMIHKKINSNVKEVLKQNIDMNTGRINYDINYKIQESFRKFSINLNNKITETLNLLLNIIQDTIQKKKETETSISQDEKFLTQQINKLAEIRNSLIKLTEEK